MFQRFFLWCAGSDRALLRYCPPGEIQKHIGFGTLVLIPAVLAFISMSYALSTLELSGASPWWYYSGGLLWGLIIFSFDRFIVSTHVRKKRNREELSHPSFYLRLLFALILSIVISHPLVLLYFDGSIEDQIQADVETHRQELRQDIEAQQDRAREEIQGLNQRYYSREEARNRQAEVVAREIDGEVLRNSTGELVTTGIAGKGPSAEAKLLQLERLERELQMTQKSDSLRKYTLYAQIASLEARKDSVAQAYRVSSDYLKRELALEKLKEVHPIVGITQSLLMLLFIFVDLLPVLFKTFAPYGLYDKLRQDDLSLIPGLNTASRQEVLEQAYTRAAALDPVEM